MSEVERFVRKMEQEGIDAQTISIFRDYFQKLVKGEKGKLSGKDITTPKPEQIMDYNNLSDRSQAALNNLAVVKLNGGLGTSMGLSKAKSLLPVKDGDTFLDIIAKQTIKTREKHAVELPIIFMNSYNTSQDTIDFLQKYKGLQSKGIPLDFLQHKYPRIKKADLTPLDFANDMVNWNPPGHGDIYNALSSVRDGDNLIDMLLRAGVEYIFVSNSDNLGAVVDAAILNYIIKEKIDFAMEVCIRTEMDKKGGHLAVTNNGKLVLRESAQCPDEEQEAFQDVNRYRYFNTNNLWISLHALKAKLTEYKGCLPLNLIINEKVVEGVPCYQIETAMGAAISVFDNAKAICVQRSRFLPVKKNQDLLLLWSDGYECNADSVLVHKEGASEPILNLDNAFYGSINQLQEACEAGVPSLFECETLSIKGKVRFGKNVRFKGCVDLESGGDVLLENITIGGK